jgi:hypothetical protein
MAEELERIERTPEELALMESQSEDINDADLVVPHLKLCQGTTKNVPDGVHPGDFFNALTGENYGTEISFTVAAFKKGRFGVDKETDEIIASGFDPVDPVTGMAWEDHPDAEEQYSARANRGDIEWGSGPPISTTYNYFGYVNESPVPVRYSMMRSAAPAAKKWLTMLRFLPAFWDQKFTLTSKLIEKGKQKYHGVDVVQAPGKTTPEERQQAVTLAMAVKTDRVKTDEDLEDQAPEKRGPEKTSGLGV